MYDLELEIMRPESIGRVVRFLIFSFQHIRSTIFRAYGLRLYGVQWPCISGKSHAHSAAETIFSGDIKGRRHCSIWNLPPTFCAFANLPETIFIC